MSNRGTCRPGDGRWYSGYHAGFLGRWLRVRYPARYYGKNIFQTPPSMSSDDAAILFSRRTWESNNNNNNLKRLVLVVVYLDFRNCPFCFARRCVEGERVSGLPKVGFWTLRTALVQVFSRNEATLQATVSVRRSIIGKKLKTIFIL